MVEVDGFTEWEERFQIRRTVMFNHRAGCC